MEEFRVKSTSRDSAIGEDIVVRDGDTVRLVFRPEIVNNPHNAAASIRGTFIYQRKGKNQAWNDYPAAPLSTLKKGEGYQLEIHAGELLPLLRQLGALYRLYSAQGVPQGRLQYVRLEENLAKFLTLSEADVNAFLSAHTADALQTLHKVLRWLSSSTALSDFVAGDANQVSILNALLGVANLRAVARVWETNADNADEGFWQEMLAAHSFVFSQLFAYPILVIKDKAYVGGKRLDNLHGNLVDFLARAQTSGNALLIEIKTPATRLLGNAYRDDVYPPSREMSGSIMQLLHYRDSLLQEFNTLNQGEPAGLLAVEPRCLVIIGNAERELESDSQRRSFELLRDRVAGVTTVTFDELFRRIGQLESLLSGPDGELT